MKRLMISLACLFTLQAWAAAPTIEAVTKKIPDISTVKSVSPTPVKGIYEVVTEDRVIYVTEELNHVFIGHLLDVATRKSLTEPVLKKVQEQAAANMQNKIEQQKPELVKALNNMKDQFLVEKKGNGSRVVYMVTDIQCGYCRKMEAVLDKMTDLTIYRIPVAYLGPNSQKLGVKALCAKDPVAAWKKLAVTPTAEVESAGSCNEATWLAKGDTLARAFNVRGTPTLIKQDGDRFPGAMDQDMFELFLSKDSSAVKAAMEATQRAAANAASSVKPTK